MDPEIGKCPRVGLTDAEISACFTHVFKEDLLPYYKDGIPQLGIQGLDPIMVPRVTFPLYFNGFIELKVNVEDIVITGLSNMTGLEINVDRQSTKAIIAASQTHPKIEFKSVKANLEGRVFGQPIKWPQKRDGEIYLRVDDFSVVATAYYKPNVWELVKHSVAENGMKDFVITVQEFGSTRTNSIINSVLRRYSTQVFRYFIKTGLLEMLETVFKEWMEPKVWNEIFKDLD